MSRLAKLEAMLAAEPNDVFLNFGVAMELAKAGRYQESLERFSRVIELDPHYIVAYMQKARTLLQTGDREQVKLVLAAGIEQAKAAGDRHAVDEMEEMLRATGA